MGFDFSVVGVPFRMQPGLCRIPVGTAQLTPSRPGSRHLREKLAVLAAFAQRALCSVPGHLEVRALEALAVDAAATGPLAWSYRGVGDCAAPMLGWALSAGQPSGDGDPEIGAVLGALPAAQRAAGLLSLAYQEDFAIIDGATGTVPWLAVCLPSRWSPEAKIGQHFAAIHGPVADNASLLAAADGLIKLVSGGERWERFVWTVTPDPRLCQHPALGVTAWPEGSSADLVAQTWLRSERQTFLPIPGSGQAVFTIRVDSEPLRAVVARPEDAARLHDSLLSMSPEVLAYRGLEPARDRLLSWLAEA